MRCAIILGADRYNSEYSEVDPDSVPRLEFVEIAKALGADILSYDSAAARGEKLFRVVFNRSKKIGSAVNAAMLANKYDRLYITAEGVGLPLAILLKIRRWNGRIICVFHNMSSRYKRTMLTTIGHDMFAGFVTVNELQAKVLTDTCRIPSEKVISVFNWVDTKFFQPVDFISAATTPFIMACGAENRDYELLARVARRIDFKFNVYGHGFMAENVKALNSPDNMIYMPRVPYSKLQEAYAASQIVVVPLHDVPFAAGVTGIVEAMSAGRPVIVTASRGVQNYLTSFDPDTIVPAGDDKAMARAVMRLIESPSIRQKLGEQNRKFAELNCSVDNYATRISELMQST